MADRYWLGTTDAVYSTAANWSATSGGAPGGVKPGAGDDVFFDGAGDNPCTLDEATAAINSLSVHSAGDPGGVYTALLDFNDQAVNVTGGGDMTFDGTGIVSCGTGTSTCSGHFDNQHQGTWTPETSVIKLDGAAKNLTGNTANVFYDLEIDGSITIVAATTTRVIVSNELKINNGKSLTAEEQLRFETTLTNSGTLTINDASISVTANITNTGTIDGSSTLIIYGGTITNSGTWSISNTSFLRSLTLGAGTYGGTCLCESDSGAAILTLGAGTIIFTGDATLRSDVTQGYTVAANTNDASLEFRGDVLITELAGTLTWNKAATGTVTFAAGSGTQVYTDSTAAIQDLGLVFHDDGGGGGTLQLATEMECTTFDGDDGTFDPNGQTIDVSGNVDWDLGWDFIGDADALNGSKWEIGGNFTAEAQTCKATAGWDLDVVGTAVASGAGDVEHCTAGITEIDASANPWTDSGNNTNWNFGAAVAAPTSHLYGPLVGPLGGAV